MFALPRSDATSPAPERPARISSRHSPPQDRNPPDIIPDSTTPGRTPAQLHPGLAAPRPDCTPTRLHPSSTTPSQSGGTPGLVLHNGIYTPKHPVPDTHPRFRTTDPGMSPPTVTTPAPQRDPSPRTNGLLGPKSRNNLLFRDHSPRTNGLLGPKSRKPPTFRDRTPRTRPALGPRSRKPPAFRDPSPRTNGLLGPKSRKPPAFRDRTPRTRPALGPRSRKPPPPHFTPCCRADRRTRRGTAPG